MAIGETVLGAVLNVVFERLASKEFINFLRSSKLDQSLVDKLKLLMLAVSKLLDDAEEKQHIHLTVKQWLDELRHWFYRAEEIVDQIATEALRSSIESPPNCRPFVSKVRNLICKFSSTSSFETTVTTEIKEVISMLETMLSQKDALGLMEHSLAARTRLDQRAPTTCLMEDSVVFGRHHEKNKILEVLLCDDNREVDVVTIVGMGGLGKTTLAKLVYNDSKLNDNFDLKAWVCVSDQFDVTQVTKSILESISGQTCSGSPDMNFLHTKLRSELMEKRFLLVLDDVWNENYGSWLILRAPFLACANGSKIIVTTRNDGVASIMQTSPVIHLESLSDEDGWSLFSRHAFGVGNLSAHASLEKIGRKIVQKCQGLPLAIITIGGLLRSTQAISEWERILHSKLWNLPADKNDIIPALRLSYYNLPSHLKRCFSYYALFPKNYSIHRNELVCLWMAENFVSSDGKRMEDNANEYLRQLLSRSLLQSSDGLYVTMHDLVHDLAEGVLGDLFIRRELSHPPKFSKKTRHLSYFSDWCDGIAIFQSIHEAKNLRTFMKSLALNGPGYLSEFDKKVSMELLPELSCLRVLGVPGYRNLYLPEAIGRLKQLRYFDISKSKVKQLPESVSTLHNLQTLVLSRCHCLRSLPKDLGRLDQLRHLYLDGTTSLLQMPRQMGQLKNLQTLTDFVVGKGGGSSIKELRTLSDIRGKLTLRQLQNISSPEDVLDAQMSKREHLHELNLQFGTHELDDFEGKREILENLKPHADLEILTIRNYAGNKFPGWLLDGHQVYLRNMTSLCLSGCLYCDTLPPLGQFSSLKVLQVERMDNVISVGPEFYGHNSALGSPFPALSHLSFKKMKSWKVWSNIDCAGNGVWFPHLCSLTLVDCPLLSGHLPIHIPLLEQLTINNCEQLTNFFPRVPSIHQLKVAACPRADLASALDLISITTLALRGLPQLVMLPPEISRLSFLISLYIVDCKNLNSLANLRLPTALKSLEIKKCGAVELLPKNLKSLTHLDSLVLHDCPCVKRLLGGDNLPTSLVRLEIHSCERLKFPISLKKLHEYTNLKSLVFKKGGKLMYFPLGILPNLRVVSFKHCKDLKKVYVPEEKDSNSLAALYELKILNCPKLKIIGKKTGSREATILPAPNLSHLKITCGDNMKPVLLQTEKEISLSMLQELVINNLEKMPHWWIPKISFIKFSHLEMLWLSDYNAECFPNETVGSLPTSLKHLFLIRFKNLRALNGKALQSLTSLQTLGIHQCPLLQGLPEERLPPSLGWLDMNECPLLEARCQPEKGLDWSKITHLSCIRINSLDVI